MKKLSIFFLSFCVSGLILAQSGPGGVGNSSNNSLWLDASQLTLSNNDPVSSWTDFSGNGNHATQGTASEQPTFKTNQINGLPSVEFDGTDYLDLTADLTSEALSVFFVYDQLGTNTWNSILSTNKAYFAYESSISRFFEYASWSSSNIRTQNGPSLFSANIESGSAGSISLTSDVYTDSNTRNGFFPNTQSSIGVRRTAKNDRFAQGLITEMIVYEEELNDAQTKIVLEYLAAKYNLVTPYSLYAHKTTYKHDVKGIGQESDGSNTTARGADRLEIANASSLDDGDYLILGSDGGDYSLSTSVPSFALDRWNRTWRADITGTPGTVDLRFYLDGGTYPGANDDLVVLGETNDQDFSNGDVSIIGSNPSFVVNGGDSYVQFNGITLTDGMTIALAEDNTDITSTSDGDWNTPATWSCNCVPTNLNNVTIQSPHVITVAANADALALDLQSGAELTFSGSPTLSVYGDLTIAGTFTEGTGTVALVSTTDVQLVENNTGSAVNFNNLRVDNNQGASFENGVWTLSNNLEVTAGGMDVTNATSFTLQSNASSSSQILESMSGAFTGDFNVERYISDRQTSYANISAPVSNANVGDLDDDFYLSGVGGSDPDILLGGGVTFYSVWQYNAATATHEEITNVSTALTPARGYEVYIEPNARTYTSGAMDYEGIPNSGTASISLSPGFNLVGNPYHSFINFGNLSASGMSSTFYIWDTDAGNYATLGTSDDIAPAQGFWVNKTTTGTTTLNFNENDKVNSNANTFLREKKSANGFKLKLSNQVNSYTHELALKFGPNASAALDEGDAFYLPSPLKEAPAILAKVEGSEQGLVINNLNQWEEAHRIPLELKAGVSGDYSIQAEDLESLYQQYNCIYLYNKDEDQNIDLSVEPTYAFYAEAGKQQRFELLLGNSFANCEQAMSQGVNQSIEDQLKLRNAHGHWFLDYAYQDQMSRNLEIKILNLNGQEVINTQSLGVSGFGTYQIEGLENLHGIYLIQIKTADAFINQKVKL